MSDLAADRWLVPWTPEQVVALGRRQICQELHPYTCGNDHKTHVALIPTPEGWRCPECDYEQAWAHNEEAFLDE